MLANYIILDTDVGKAGNGAGDQKRMPFRLLHGP
jgi:hypothetical protein